MSTMMKGECGHFFDPATNTKCPYCGIGQVDLTKGYNPGDDRTVKHVSDDDEKTQMYSSGSNTRQSGTSGTGRAGSDDPEATVALWSKNVGIDPVVGWLVCSEGPNQGRDYRLRSGYNNIGRDTSNQVCIAGDDTISRSEHAKIFFDHKNASFHVIAGSGRSGVYVNDSAVLQPTPLKPYDIVEVGKTKLVFVPFCGERFRWDTGA